MKIRIWCTLLIICSTLHAAASRTMFCNLAYDVLCPKRGPIKKMLCPRAHPLKKVLLGLIDDAHGSIYTAQYMLSDPDITQALIEAYYRGVHVEVACDGAISKESYSKIEWLLKEGIDVYAFFPKQTRWGTAIMHNKYWIFEHTLGRSHVVITGSYNCTRNACQKNWENIVVLEDADLARQYKEDFRRVKKECRRLRSVESFKVTRSKFAPTINLQERERF